MGSNLGLVAHVDGDINGAIQSGLITWNECAIFQDDRSNSKAFVMITKVVFVNYDLSYCVISILF